MANDLSMLKGHSSSFHPDPEGHMGKDLGGVKGNNPHHHAVRARDSYKSKGDIKPAAPLT